MSGVDLQRAADLVKFDHWQGTNNAGHVKVVEGYDGWKATGTSGANAALTVTKAAPTGNQHVLTAYLAVIRAAAAGNDISVAIKDEDDNILWQDYIGNAAASGTRVSMSGMHIEVPSGKAVKLVVGAGGAAVISEGNIHGYTKTA